MIKPLLGPGSQAGALRQAIRSGRGRQRRLRVAAFKSYAPVSVGLWEGGEGDEQLLELGFR